MRCVYEAYETVLYTGTGYRDQDRHTEEKNSNNVTVLFGRQNNQIAEQNINLVEAESASELV